MIVNSESEAPSGPLFAALDLGTYKCRLVIAAYDASRRRFNVVDAFSRVVRLGNGIDVHGRLDRTSMQRAIYALDICAKKMEKYPLDGVRCVATAACRQASNARDFTSMVRTRTGMNLEIISAEEEARFALAGCAVHLNPNFPYIVAFDIGGGSTEVIWGHLNAARELQVIDSISLPFGVVSLAEAKRRSKNIDQFYRTTRFKVSEALNYFAQKHNIHGMIEKNLVQVIGASGTVTTVAAFAQKLDHYDRTKVDGYILEEPAIFDVVSRMYTMDYYQFCLHPCVGPIRADLVMGGVALFQGIYDTFPVGRITVADRGVRDGILITLLQHYLKTQKK